MKYGIKNLMMILSTLFFQSCGKSQDAKMYEEALQSYPSKLINHFPEYNMEGTLSFQFFSPNATYANNWNGIHLVKNIPEKYISEIEQKAIKDAIAVVTFKDSCNYIINYDKNIFINSPCKLTLCGDTTNINYPIPNFSYCIEKNFPYDFYESAKIYVLDAEYGEFLDRKYLTKSGVGLSEIWKHGYSKGILISKSTDMVIYWLEVW